MKFVEPLQSAILIKRYKRFLADVTSADGSTLTLHCPNTGSMLSCNDPGSRVWYSTSDNLTRKYPHTWEIIENPAQQLIGINTHRANDLVFEALTNKVIKELIDFDLIKREVKLNDQSRIDFVITDKQGVAAYIEVKNVTLADANQVGYFPDAVTSRGLKHLNELITLVQQGQRAILLFCVQHTGVKQVRAAAHIDKTYADKLAQAASQGVEVLAYGCALSPAEITLQNKLDVWLG